MGVTGARPRDVARGFEGFVGVLGVTDGRGGGAVRKRGGYPHNARVFTWRHTPPLRGVLLFSPTLARPISCMGVTVVLIFLPSVPYFRSKSQKDDHRHLLEIEATTIFRIEILSQDRPDLPVYNSG